MTGDERPLAGVRVVELEGSVAGAYAAHLLGVAGASVSVVRSAQRLGGCDAVESDALDAAYRFQAEILPGGGDEADRRLARADVIIESRADGPLDVGAMARPAQILVRISPFGPSGPYAGFTSSDAVDQAVAGHLFLNGDPDRTPLVGPTHQATVAAGIHAAIGAVAALIHRRSRRDDGGQVVQVDHHSVMVALHQFTLQRYTHNGDILRRMGNRYAGPGRPIGAYACRDGMISIVAPRDDQLDRLLGVSGLDHLLDEPGIESTYDLMHHPSLLDTHLMPWVAQQDRDELIELLQAIRVPAGPVSSLAEVLDNDHLAARGFWREVDVAERTVRVPRSPFRISGPRTSGATGSVDGAGQPAVEATDGPLTGLRVLDLTRVWAGPLATRILADLGADVVMVEAPWARGPAHVDHSSVMATRYYPDNDPGDEHWNRIGFVNKYSVNKRSVGLDLGESLGRDAFADLVQAADVVVENYSPRVMPQLGFDEDRLHRLNPSLVYVTMPGYGRTGPAVNWLAYGPLIDSHAGLSVLQGYADEQARKGGVAWPDPVAGMHAAFATLAAVLATRSDGAGRTVESAQFESTVATIGHALARRQLDGVEPPRLANRHPHHAPQGVYPCAGEDRWLALTVADDAGWQALVTTLGLPAAWSGWSREERWRAHDEIDRAIAGATTDRAQMELMHELQAAGVAAGAVLDAAQVQHDPHLLANNRFITLEHPVAGAHPWPKLAITMSATPASYRRPAPCLDEHGDEILRDWARWSPARIAEARAAGVLTGRPPPS